MARWRSVIGLLWLAACGKGDHGSEVDTLWLSYTRRTASASEQLLLQEDGTFDVIYTLTPRPTVQGKLTDNVLAQLDRQLADDNAATYMRDSLSQADASVGACEPTRNRSRVYTLQWYAKRDTSPGFGCWGELDPRSAATQSLITSLNIILDAATRARPADAGAR